MSKEDKQDLAVIVFCAASLAGAALSVFRYLKLVLS